MRSSNSKSVKPISKNERLWRSETRTRPASCSTCGIAILATVLPASLKFSSFLCVMQQRSSPPPPPPPPPGLSERKLALAQAHSMRLLVERKIERRISPNRFNSPN
uniref:Uncharacterized protein n=1 Tax=Trichogramma kaykai TaxID=54128 RepID=A0ABD2X2H3_9HYME